MIFDVGIFFCVTVLTQQYMYRGSFLGGFRGGASLTVDKSGVSKTRSTAKQGASSINKSHVSSQGQSTRGQSSVDTDGKELEKRGVAEKASDIPPVATEATNESQAVQDERVSSTGSSKSGSSSSSSTGGDAAHPAESSNSTGSSEHPQSTSSI